MFRSRPYSAQTLRRHFDDRVMAISFANTRLDRSPEQHHLDDHEAIAENSSDAMSTWMPVVDLDLVALLELGLRNDVAEHPAVVTLTTTHCLTLLDLTVANFGNLALLGSHEINHTTDRREPTRIARGVNKQVIAIQGNEKVGSVTTATVDMLFAHEEHW